MTLMTLMTLTAQSFTADVEVASCIG